MKYLERVIFEALRMYPPVPLIARKVNEDVKLGMLLFTKLIILLQLKNYIFFTVSGNYTVPAGTTVIISQFAVHRNPKYYKDPDTFNPDNFLPENCQTRPYHAYIPFSAGPRSCVGKHTICCSLCYQ